MSALSAPAPPCLPGDALTFSRGDNCFNRGLEQSSMGCGESQPPFSKPKRKITAQAEANKLAFHCPDTTDWCTGKHIATLVESANLRPKPSHFPTMGQNREGVGTSGAILPPQGA